MRHLIILSCLLLLIAPPAWAKNDEHGKKKHQYRESYEHQQDERLPPGLQKKRARGKELPPGWQKKLVRGQLIDDDLYSCLEPPPARLLDQLPPPPPGVIIRTIEDKVIKIKEINRQILDVFDFDQLPPPPPRHR